jgi:gluconate 2-dehydrogenase gamma chain
MAREPGRRTFLKTVGAVAVGGAAAAAVPVPGAVEASQAATGQAPASPIINTYTFLTAPEAAFVEAVVNLIIPADDLTPNGTDCGVSVFIDRQLAGAWGKGDRLYMQGPWKPGTPTQGYQSPMTPAEYYRAGIAAVNEASVKAHGKEFDRLDVALQMSLLQGLERGTLAIEHVSGQEFFEILLASAMEGFFADPIYGGNRDKVSWKMIGFPGVIAVHAEHIKTYRNKKYEVEPTSIGDMA